MSDLGFGSAANHAANPQSCIEDGRTSERILAEMFREDLGVHIEPQALRMFIRSRFSRLSPLAHRIHDGKR